MFTACKSSSDCTQSQVNTQVTHVPNTTEQIKLAALQLLASLCYRMSDTYLHQTSQWLLQCSSTKSAEPPTELVSPHKQSLPSSADHFTSMPFSALFLLLLLLFDTGCLFPAVFSSPLPGDSPVTADDEVNLLYMTDGCCYFHCPGIIARLLAWHYLSQWGAANPHDF